MTVAMSHALGTRGVPFPKRGFPKQRRGGVPSQSGQHRERVGVVSKWENLEEMASPFGTEVATLCAVKCLHWPRPCACRSLAIWRSAIVEPVQNG